MPIYTLSQPKAYQNNYIKHANRQPVHHASHLKYIRLGNIDMATQHIRQN